MSGIGGAGSTGRRNTERVYQRLVRSSLSSMETAGAAAFTTISSGGPSRRTHPTPPAPWRSCIESYQKAVRCDVSVLDLGPVFGAAQLVDLVLPVCWARGRTICFHVELITRLETRHDGAVLNDASVDQLKCLERAASATAKPGTAISPAARSRFQDAASHWLSLADSYALSEAEARPPLWRSRRRAGRRRPAERGARRGMRRRDEACRRGRAQCRDKVMSFNDGVTSIADICLSNSDAIDSHHHGQFVCLLHRIHHVLAGGSAVSVSGLQRNLDGSWRAAPRPRGNKFPPWSNPRSGCWR